MDVVYWFTGNTTHCQKRSPGATLTRGRHLARGNGGGGLRADGEHLEGDARRRAVHEEHVVGERSRPRFGGQPADPAGGGDGAVHGGWDGAEHEGAHTTAYRSG